MAMLEEGNGHIMLAERRHKKVIKSYMLKKKPLAPDSCEKGFNMLLKMGWSQGKGLGVNEDGSPDPLFIRFKCDSKGLGFKESEKEALSCQEDFNALLSKLSQQVSHSPEVSATNDEGDSATSLELLSRQSRARVHYQKFTRGKDLSRATSKDLLSILGFSNEKPSEIPAAHDIQSSPVSSNDQGVTGSLMCSSKQEDREEKQNGISQESPGLNAVKQKEKKRKFMGDYTTPCESEQQNASLRESSSSERRKSVTWGEVQVSYVSKYISDMADTSNESLQNGEVSFISRDHNNAGSSNNDKKKRETANILVENSENKHLDSENPECGTSDAYKKTKEKKKKKKNKEEDSACISSSDLFPNTSDLDNAQEGYAAESTRGEKISEDDSAESKCKKSKKRKKIESTKNPTLNSLEFQNFECGALNVCKNRKKNKDDSDKHASTVNTSDALFQISDSDLAKELHQGDSTERDKNEKRKRKKENSEKHFLHVNTSDPFPQISDSDLAHETYQDDSKEKEKKEKGKKKRENSEKHSLHVNISDPLSQISDLDHAQETHQADSMKKSKKEKRKKKRENSENHSFHVYTSDPLSQISDSDFPQETHQGDTMEKDKKEKRKKKRENSEKHSLHVNISDPLPQISDSDIAQGMEREKKEERKRKRESFNKESDGETYIVGNQCSETIFSPQYADKDVTRKKKKKLKLMKDCAYEENSSNDASVVNSSSGSALADESNSPINEETCTKKRKPKKRIQQENNNFVHNETLPSHKSPKSNYEQSIEKVPSSKHVLKFSISEDDQLVTASDNKPTLSLSTCERMAKWKKRQKSHRDSTNESNIAVNSNCVRDASPSLNGNQQEGPKIWPLPNSTKAKKHDSFEVSSIKFLGSNLESIQGYGCALGVDYSVL